MTCICQECGQNYMVDLMISDEMWEQIKPTGKPVGAGLLCGPCIMIKIEAQNKYRSFDMTNVALDKGGE